MIESRDPRRRRNYLYRAKGRWPGPLHWAGELERGDPLRMLEAIGMLRRMLDEYELIAVRGAIVAGYGWQTMARRLGVSRQAVFARYVDIDLRAPPPDPRAYRGPMAGD